MTLIDEEDVWDELDGKYKAKNIILDERIKLSEFKIVDKKLCMEAVKQDGATLQFVKEQTKEICMEAVKQDGIALQYVKNKLMKYVWKQ